MSYKIYWLSDPETGEMRYVGKTKQTLQKRYYYHCHPDGKSHNTKWINSLLKKSLRPNINVLQTLSSEDDMNMAEVYWIAYFKSVGCRLTNECIGGRGGSIKGKKRKPCSEETKRKISIAKKGKKQKLHSEEARKRMSDIKKGKKLSDEHRQKLSLAHKGKKRGPVSEETKRKISVATFGKSRGPHSEETKQRISIANTGKKHGFHSEETKQKISITNTGRVLSIETRKRMSDARKGKKLSNEHKHLDCIE